MTSPNREPGAVLSSLSGAFLAGELGAKVVPLDGKKPARDKQGNYIGQTRGTTDPATLHEWFEVDGVHNVGGVVPAWGVGVDVDPRSDGLASLERLLAEAGIPLPSTYTTRSGRNDGGIHLWFRKRAGVKLSAAAYPGIDLKDGCGILVMPGSKHPETGLPYTVQNGGEIIDLPAELYPLLEVKPLPRRAPVYVAPFTARGQNRLAAWVRRSLNGKRNEDLYWALCRAVEHGYEQAIVDEIMQAGVDVGLPPEEVEDTYRSALRTEGQK
jgi:hypothetical protein